MLQGPSAHFYGWQVFSYVGYLLDAYLSQYPWQVEVSLFIIALSSLTAIILFILFCQHIFARKHEKRQYEAMNERFRDAFREILNSDVKMSREEMEYICGADCSEMQDILHPAALMHVIVSLRIELSKKVFLPNMQRLCTITGVQAYLEQNMVKGNHVEQTLQVLMTLPLRITEGALAAYTGHKNKRIRELARSYYGFCSKLEPFLFVIKDVNEPFQLWYPTTFHRLCGWHQAKYHPTPRLMELARRSRNDDRKALFISEIPYFGTQEEKQSLKDVLEWPSPKCRSAAINAIAIIGDPNAEEDLIRTYSQQFPAAKRETLRAVCKINTGKQIDFFRQAYLHSTSQDTRAVALACLYNYGYEGRKTFEELALSGLDDNRFFQQITVSDHKF